MASSNNKPTGTKATKYAGSLDGPFRCDRCVHFLATQGKGLCDHPDVIEDKEISKEEYKNKEYAKVDAGGCCEYFRSIKRIFDVPFGSVGL